MPASAAFKSQQREATCNRSHISTTRRASYSEIQIRNVYSESFALSTSCVIKPSVRFLLHRVRKRDYWKLDKLHTTKQLKFTIYHTIAEHFLVILHCGDCSLNNQIKITQQNLNESINVIYKFLNKIIRRMCCFKMRYIPWVWDWRMSGIDLIMTNFSHKCSQNSYQ